MSNLSNNLNLQQEKHSVFECESEKAKAIFLAGSFNDWNPGSTPMTREGTSHWIFTHRLPPGRYEYKFVIDGEWCCEPGCDASEVECPNCVMNEFGTMNRVLEVVEA